MPTGFSSAINTFPSPNTRDKGASLAFYNSSPTSSGDLPVATVGPSPALQLHPAPVQPPDQSLGVTQEQPRQVCAWFGELSQGTAGWVDPCAAGEGANGSRRLGDGIGPSLLPLWQAECLQPCSSQQLWDTRTRHSCIDSAQHTHGSALLGKLWLEREQTSGNRKRCLQQARASSSSPVHFQRRKHAAGMCPALALLRGQR